MNRVTSMNLGYLSVVDAYDSHVSPRNLHGTGSAFQLQASSTSLADGSQQLHSPIPAEHRVMAPSTSDSPGASHQMQASSHAPPSSLSFPQSASSAAADPHRSLFDSPISPSSNPLSLSTSSHMSDSAHGASGVFYTSHAASTASQQDPQVPNWDSFMYTGHATIEQVDAGSGGPTSAPAAAAAAGASTYGSHSGSAAAAATTSSMSSTLGPLPAAVAGSSAPFGSRATKKRSVALPAAAATIEAVVSFDETEVSLEMAKRWLEWQPWASETAVSIHLICELCPLEKQPRWTCFQGPVKNIKTVFSTRARAISDHWKNVHTRLVQPQTHEDSSAMTQTVFEGIAHPSADDAASSSAETGGTIPSRGESRRQLQLPYPRSSACFTPLGAMDLNSAAPVAHDVTHMEMNYEGRQHPSQPFPARVVAAAAASSLPGGGAAHVRTSRSLRLESVTVSRVMSFLANDDFTRSGWCCKLWYAAGSSPLAWRHTWHVRELPRGAFAVQHEVPTIRHTWLMHRMATIAKSCIWRNLTRLHLPDIFRPVQPHLEQELQLLTVWPNLTRLTELSIYGHPPVYAADMLPLLSQLQKLTWGCDESCTISQECLASFGHAIRRLCQQQLVDLTLAGSGQHTIFSAVAALPTSSSEPRRPFALRKLDLCSLAPLDVVDGNDPSVLHLNYVVSLNRLSSLQNLVLCISPSAAFELCSHLASFRQLLYLALTVPGGATQMQPVASAAFSPCTDAWTELMNLSLHGFQLDAGAFRQLRHLRKLQSVILLDCPLLDNAALRALLRLRDLEALTIEKCPRVRMDLPLLHRIASCTSLALMSFPGDAEFFAAPLHVPSAVEAERLSEQLPFEYKLVPVPGAQDMYDWE